MASSFIKYPNQSQSHRILANGDQNQIEFPLASLPDLFLDQVLRTPDIIAVQSGAETLTYLELNIRANQLAHYLQANGVTPGAHVAICLERSLDLIVGILGILKTGSAYIPLDPAYPAERLSFMLGDSNAVALVTNSQLRNTFTQYAGRRIDVDLEADSIEHQPDCESEIKVMTHDLAYIIYTSGSSGYPKGVMVEHFGWANYVRAAQQMYQLTPGERVLQFASISWDTSAEEIFPCLTSGATLVLRTTDMIDSIQRFLQNCSAWEISVLSLPTAFWHELVNQLSAENLVLPSSLRVVIFGGERAHWEVLSLWRKLAPPSVRLFNTYGQTECTAVTTCVELTPENTSVAVPIGRAVQNVWIYILDENLVPVSAGQAGELYVGGPGLARGYYNQPELTAQKFIPNPFEEWGGRLYKTGDVVRAWLDGNLEFIGRVDHQVKIRGIRIEPGEVESALLQHPAVHSVVVMGYPLGSPEYLAAYVVLDAGESMHASALRNWLTERLPAHLVPAVIMPLNALPLNPNGKVDRRALPVPEFSRHVSNRDEPEVLTETEAELKRIWQELLGLQSIGLHDNFFEIGGHSMLVVRLMTQLEKRFNKSLSLALVFHTPTIAQMAKILEDQGWKPSWTSLVPIRPDGSLPPMFCVHADGGAFFYTRFANYLSPEQPFYGLQARGLDGVEPPFTRVEDMAAHYISEIRMVQPHGPHIISGFSMGGVVIYEMAQQLVAAGEPAPLVIFLDAPSPMYFEQQDKRISGKLINLTRLSAQERFQRMGLRLGQRYRWLVDEFLTRLFLKLNYPLPPDLRIHRVREMNNRIADAYQPRPYAGPIFILRASEQIRRNTPDPTLGWSYYVSGKIMDYVIPGDHETIFHEPNVQIMAQTLQACIDLALAEQNSNSTYRKVP